MNKLLLTIMLSSSLLMISCSPTNKKSSALHQRTTNNTKPTAPQLEAGAQVAAIDDIDQNMSPEQIEAQLIELRAEFNKLDDQLISLRVQRSLLKKEIQKAEPAEKEDLEAQAKELRLEYNTMVKELNAKKAKIKSLVDQLRAMQK